MAECRLATIEKYVGLHNPHWQMAASSSVTRLYFLWIDLKHTAACSEHHVVSLFILTRLGSLGNLRLLGTL